MTNQQTGPVPLPENRTDIYKFSDFGEDWVGCIGPDGTIYKVRWETGIAVGRIEEAGDRVRIFRNTRHDERELGTVDHRGQVHSHGLFEGGALGWLDREGVVIQGGLILGEEEVGRVEGPDAAAAAAALLLLFLPDDAEASREMTRRG